MKHVSLCCNRLQVMDFAHHLTDLVFNMEQGEVLEFGLGDDFTFHVVIIDDDKEENEND